MLSSVLVLGVFFFFFPSHNWLSPKRTSPLQIIGRQQQVQLELKLVVPGGSRITQPESSRKPWPCGAHCPAVATLPRPPLEPHLSECTAPHPVHPSQGLGDRNRSRLGRGSEPG